MINLLLAGLILIQYPGRDAATFVRRVSELDAASQQRAAAASPAARADTTLQWLRALRAVLKSIPIERADGPHHSWLKVNEELAVYSEPAGEWLINHTLIKELHAAHTSATAADDIAWLAVTNGLPGECEGYIPCYASGLNTLEGDYLRAHPNGAHRQEALDLIVQTLRIALDDLLQRPERADYLTVPRDCDDLLHSMRPLRDAIAAARGAGTDALTLADRAIALCAGRQ